MRIGILSFAYNLSEESPIASLPRVLREKGHEVVFLDTDTARIENGELVFLGLPAGAKLDAFIPYLPSTDWDVLNNGARPGDVPYFDQLRILSEKFPTPWPYETQAIVNDKNKMREVFSSADLPIPQTYSANDPESRRKVLFEIKSGKTFVFKPCFGGNSEGVIKIDTEQEAEIAFTDIDRQGVGFVAQHFIQSPKIDGKTVDYRAFVIGNNVVGLRCVSGNWKRDYDGAGTIDEPHEFTPQQKIDAVKAVHSAGMMMGSVDILIDAQTGQHYISEIGDNIALDEYYEALGKDRLSQMVVEMLEDQYGPDAKPTFCAKKFSDAHHNRKPDITPPQLINVNPMPDATHE